MDEILELLKSWVPLISVGAAAFAWLWEKRREKKKDCVDNEKTTAETDKIKAETLQTYVDLSQDQAAEIEELMEERRELINLKTKYEGIIDQQQIDIDLQTKRTNNIENKFLDLKKDFEGYKANSKLEVSAIKKENNQLRAYVKRLAEELTMHDIPVPEMT